MNEVNRRQCKVCKTDQDRILSGKFPGVGGNKKWKGANGKLWSGNLCPDCNTKRVKEVMQKNRAKNET